MMIRPAHPDDVEAIRALFADEVAAGRMLPRAAHDIRANIRNWLVAETGRRIVGCVSLVQFNPALGELRSLAVDPNHRGQRIATELIQALAALADERGLERLLVLTRAASLFERAGFHRDYVANFPEKVWRDCAPCPFRHACDEVALIFPLHEKELSGVSSYSQP